MQVLRKVIADLCFVHLTRMWGPAQGSWIPFGRLPARSCIRNTSLACAQFGPGMPSHRLGPRVTSPAQAPIAISLQTRK